VKPTRRFYFAVALMLILPAVFYTDVLWHFISMVAFFSALIAVAYSASLYIAFLGVSTVRVGEPVDMPLVVESGVPFVVRYYDPEIMLVLRLLKLKDAWIIGDAGLKTVSWRLGAGGLELEVLTFTGSHRVRGVGLRAEDPLGFVEVNAAFIHDEVVVKAVKPFKGEGLVQQLVAGALYGISVAKRRRGRGDEFYGVREYMPGDEYSRIFWKAFARLGKLYVKEFEFRLGYRGFVITAALHDGFFAERKPAVEYIAGFLFNTARTLVEKGHWIKFGVVTERSVLVSEIVREGNIFALSSFLSGIDWPEKPSTYVSSNKVLRWFTKSLVRDSCREPCNVIVILDPMDSADAVFLRDLARELREAFRSHVQVYLTAPILLGGEGDQIAQEIYRFAERSKMFIRSFGNVAPVYVLGFNKLLRLSSGSTYR